MGWQSAIGVAAFLGLAWALGENRRRVDVVQVAVGFLLTVATALVLIRFPPSRGLFALLNRMVLAVQEATLAGTGFVFGYLGGAPLPFVETVPGSSFVLAFQALPMVLVMSALASLLFHWGVLPAVVRCVCVGAAQDPADRRGGGGVQLGQRVRGHGRGAALRAALPRSG